MMAVHGGPRAREINRGQLIDAIRGAGQISRVELVRQMGSNAATVSTVVRELIDDGLVTESGRAQSTGGKPRVLLSLIPDACFALGVGLDHAGISYVVTNLGGAVVGRLRRRGTGADDPGTVVARIGEEMMSLADHVGVERERLLGVGVVSPGPVTESTGIALTPPVMDAWRHYPLVEALTASTGLPVLTENDASAAAVGEYWSGLAGGSRCFAALYMGTGLGAGVMNDGIVYRGASGNTGEVGHLCVDIDGPQCWCGGNGCVEIMAGPTAVVAEARRQGRHLPGLSVTEDFSSLVRMAREGDKVAVELLIRSARYVAVAAQALANMLDPDLIILTGPSFRLAGSLYLPIIRERLDTTFFARGCHPVDVVLSPNAAEAAAIGGAALVLQRELAPHMTPLGPPSTRPTRRRVAV